MRRDSPLPYPLPNGRVLTHWRAHLISEDYSQRTIDHRIATMRFISRSVGVAPERLTQAHLSAFLTKGSYRPRTRENYLITVRLFCTWAQMDDITEAIRRPRIPPAIPKPVSELDLEALLRAAADDPRTLTWLVLGAYAGLRSCESAAVRSSDLHQSPHGWVLRVIGKGDSERAIPLPPIVVEVLQHWISRTPFRGPLWPDANPRTVQRAIRKAADRAGVRCSSHQLRHRYGTATYRVSRDLLVVQQLLGHASPSHTAGYAKVDLLDACDTVLRLPGAAVPLVLEKTAS